MYSIQRELEIEMYHKRPTEKNMLLIKEVTVLGKKSRTLIHLRTLVALIR